MFYLACISVISVALLVWFQSNAFVEYCELLHLTKLFYLSDYLQMVKEGATLSYLDFLVEFHNSFFVRLITCPICVSVWAGFFVGLLTGTIWCSSVYSLFGLITYLVTVKLL